MERFHTKSFQRIFDQDGKIRGELAALTRELVMATSLNPHSHHLTMPRNMTQKVCIGMGIAFVLAGLGGIVMPGLMGLHLSLSHNMIHLASGALSLWSGYSDDPKKSYNFCIGFGVVYGLLGLAGFVFGQPGYPGVGHMEADENLLRVIPNVLELGSADHVVHILFSLVFLGTAYMWKKQHSDISPSRRLKVNRTSAQLDEQDLLNSESNLKDAKLGRSDVNRKSDIHRRSDYERRI
jgi:hypothetical protein